MANPIKPRPTTHIEEEFTRKGFSRPTVYAIRQLIQRSDKTQTDNGEIQAEANVTGRPEQIQTTLKNLDNDGNLQSLVNVNDTSTDHLTDGTGSPLTGGKRGFVALDTNSRLANSFRANPVNVSNTPTSSATLSNDGVSTAIAIAASSNQFPPGLVSYNSGSVDPGSFGTEQFITALDPTFAGGAVPYSFSPSVQSQTAAEGLVPMGAITTANGVAKTGGGSTGGTGGRAGGRGYIQG